VRRCPLYLLPVLIGLLLALAPVQPSAQAATRAHAAYVATAPTPGALYRDGQSGRYLLGGSWLYRPDPNDAGLAAGWGQSGAATSGWTPVTVPNAYNAGDLTAASMWGSVGWYRRDFVLPAGAFSSYVPRAARRWIIRFESVNYYATVWLNGRELGEHEGGYMPFEFDLTGLRPGVNRLIVRVDDRRHATSFPPGPAGGWWNFGGITREVYLRAVQRADIAQVSVRTIMPCFFAAALRQASRSRGCPATIEERAWVRNPTGHAQTVALTGHYGPVALNFGRARIAPGATWTPSAQATLAHPDLWAPGHPHLYSATLALSDGAGRPLSSYFTYSGARTIAVTPGGRLVLNGRLLNLRGVSIHEQDLAEGSALDPAHLARLFGWAKAIGAGIIRAHYPLNPQIEEMADRSGILLWSEVPIYQVGPSFYGLGSWQARADALLASNIALNQNHPAVLLWSIGNELNPNVGSGETAYIDSAVAVAHRLDPTRPVGMAIAPYPGLPCQPGYAALDVIGVNEYFGMLDIGDGSNDDRDALSPFLDFLRACYPHQAMMVSEFGFEGNRPGPVEERGTYQFQDNSTAFDLGVFASKRWLSGAIYFPLQDFAAQPGWNGGDPWGDPPFTQKGPVDKYGNKKPLFGVMSALYHATRQIAPAP
jgi:beta-glucuronidase